LPVALPDTAERDDAREDVITKQENIFAEPSRSANTVEEEYMMADNKHDSGFEEGVKGVVEGVKGKIKEAVGTVTGRDDLVKEGHAQQDKADAARDAAKKEAQADAARAGERAAEERQKANQRPQS
jgi:uncharacterized protein YjbJ (UPF0337 family)